MKVRMKTMAAGPDGVLLADRVYNLPSKQAKALVEGGYAVEDKSAKAEEPQQAPERPQRETATRRGRERAVKE